MLLVSISIGQVRSGQWRKKSSKYKLDLVGVQEVRFGGGGTEPAGEYTFFYGKGNENHVLGTGFFVHKRIISAVISHNLFTSKYTSTIGQVSLNHLKQYKSTTLKNIQNDTQD
jgi:hypothetical protein